MFERLFKLAEHNTSIKTELIAGITTFMTMAYIIFVQAHVLEDAGMNAGAVMVATCLASALACLLMGFLANYPIGLAPGMGENFFFTYTIVLAMDIPWEKALGMVFISGAMFIALSFFRVRELVIDAIPACLKQGIAVGIGLFIAFIGLHEAGIIVQNPGGLVQLGHLNEPPVILAILGFAIMAILTVRGVKVALFVGIITTAVLGAISGILTFDGIVSAPPSIKPTFFKLDILGILHWDYLIPILVLLYMDMFDTVGTLIGTTSQAGLMKDGKLPRASKALLSDAIGTTAGALLGTSTITSYIESITGIKAGGRTGLTAVTVGILFVVAIFFYPLVAMIADDVNLSSGLAVHPVTAPALILVGAMMMTGIKHIQWDNLFEAIPAFLTIIAIPFTFSIADGIAIGFISYPILMFAGRRGKEVSPLVYVLAALFILRYIFLS